MEKQLLLSDILTLVCSTGNLCAVSVSLEEVIIACIGIEILVKEAIVFVSN